eukprot:1138702-Pelagomonas_calceolata.AAC.9
MLHCLRLTFRKNRFKEAPMVALIHPPSQQDKQNKDNNDGIVDNFKGPSAEQLAANYHNDIRSVGQHSTQHRTCSTKIQPNDPLPFERT